MNSVEPCNSIVYAVATPSGRAAIATVIVFGDGVESVISNLVENNNCQPVYAKVVGKVYYGHWLKDGRRGEDVVICKTESNRVEIHCHGGYSAVDTIKQSLERMGAIRCDTMELASELHHGIYWADYFTALSKIQTERLASVILNQQVHHQNMLQDLTFAIQSRDLAAVDSLIDNAMTNNQDTLSLFRTRKIAICGMPNVGKSSLINALLGFNRVIVSQTPGTTRDLVATETAFAGFPVSLVDTAGIRETSSEIEQAGIELAHQASRKADVRILVIGSDSPESIESQSKELDPELIVANKSDLGRIDHPLISCHVSALKIEGIELLIDMISNLLNHTTLEANAYIPFTSSQLNWLSEIRALSAQSKWTDLDGLMNQLSFEN